MEDDQQNISCKKKFASYSDHNYFFNLEDNGPIFDATTENGLSSKDILDLYTDNSSASLDKESSKESNLNQSLEGKVIQNDFIDCFLPNEKFGLSVKSCTSNEVSELALKSNDAVNKHFNLNKGNFEENKNFFPTSTATDNMEKYTSPQITNFKSCGEFVSSEQVNVIHEETVPTTVNNPSPDPFSPSNINEKAHEIEKNECHSTLSNVSNFKIQNYNGQKLVNTDIAPLSFDDHPGGKKYKPKKMHSFFIEETSDHKSACSSNGEIMSRNKACYNFGGLLHGKDCPNVEKRALPSLSKLLAVIGKNKASNYDDIHECERICTLNDYDENDIEISNDKKLRGSKEKASCSISKHLASIEIERTSQHKDATNEEYSSEKELSMVLPIDKKCSDLTCSDTLSSFKDNSEFESEELSNDYSIISDPGKSHSELGSFTNNDCSPDNAMHKDCSHNGDSSLNGKDSFIMDVVLSSHKTNSNNKNSELPVMNKASPELKGSNMDFSNTEQNASHSANEKNFNKQNEIQSTGKDYSDEKKMCFLSDKNCSDDETSDSLIVSSSSSTCENHQHKFKGKKDFLTNENIQEKLEVFKSVKMKENVEQDSPSSHGSNDSLSLKTLSNAKIELQNVKSQAFRSSYRDLVSNIPLTIKIDDEQNNIKLSETSPVPSIASSSEKSQVALNVQSSPCQGSCFSFKDETAKHHTLDTTSFLKNHADCKSDASNGIICLEKNYIPMQSHVDNLEDIQSDCESSLSSKRNSFKDEPNQHSIDSKEIPSRGLVLNCADQSITGSNLLSKELEYERTSQKRGLSPNEHSTYCHSNDGGGINSIENSKSNSSSSMLRSFLLDGPSPHSNVQKLKSLLNMNVFDSKNKMSCQEEILENHVKSEILYGPIHYYDEIKTFRNHIQIIEPQNVTKNIDKNFPLTLNELLKTSSKLAKFQNNNNSSSGSILDLQKTQEPLNSYFNKINIDLIYKMKNEFSSKLEDIYNANRYSLFDDNDLASLTENDAILETPSLLFSTLKCKLNDDGVTNNYPFDFYENRNPLVLQNLLRDLGTNSAYEWLHAESIRKNRESCTAQKTVLSFKSSNGSQTGSLAISDMNEKARLNLKKSLIKHCIGFRYFCKKCSFSSENPQIFVEHIDALHISLNLHSSTVSTHCSLCSRKFPSNERLRRHILVCANFTQLLAPIGVDVYPAKTQKPIKKSLIDALYKGKVKVMNSGSLSSSSLRSFQSTLTQKRPIKVSTSIGKPPENLLSHLAKPPELAKEPFSSSSAPPKIVQLSENADNTAKRRKLNSEMSRYNFVCELCDGHVQFLASYQLHMERKHNLIIPLSKLSDPMFKCNHCLQNFITAEGFGRHFTIRHGICYQPQNSIDSGTCGFCFQVVTHHLKSHIENTHGFKIQDSQLLFKCSLCFTTLSSYSEYIRHFTALHLNSN